MIHVFDQIYVPYSATNESKSRGQNKTRNARAAIHDLTFIAVDGEGIDDDYVMLSVGDRTLHRDGKPLTHDDIFPFLYAQYRANPTAVFIGFSLGYDFTHWLKGVTLRDAYALFDPEGIAKRRPKNPKMANVPFPVRTPNGEWEFDLMGNGKRFRLRPNSRIYGRQGWLYISDVFGYWQTSFVRAIDPARWPEPICTPEEYATILEGKARRDDAEFNEQMGIYNRTENVVLARMMATLNRGMVESSNVRLTKDKWFGPGQAAQQWLRLTGSPFRTDVIDATPAIVRERSMQAYFGGWFENMVHGIQEGSAYSYDIISAYPSAIATLPCLLHGRWETVPYRSLRPKDIALVRGHVAGTSGRTGPMPHRLTTGGIIRPNSSYGTYWWHELQASRRAGLLNRIGQVEDVWRYNPCDCPPPLAAIRDLYERRLQVGKSTPQGKAIKVIMNSTYGKMAQTVGKPLFSNMIYAGMITSLCRTQILDAIATHPDGAQAVMMVNTDGITFRSRHPNLEQIPDKLGSWEEAIHTDLVLFLPGIYWELDDGSAHIKRRGIPNRNAEDMREQATAAFQQWTEGEEWPIVTLVIPWKFTTAKLAYSRGKWETAGSSLRNVDQVLHANPVHKRRPLPGLKSTPYTIPEMYPSQREKRETVYYVQSETVWPWQEDIAPWKSDQDGIVDEEFVADLIDTIKPDGGI